MEYVLMVVGVAGGFALGWLVGFRLGERVREKKAWRYWTLNVAVVVLGVAVNTLGLALQQAWLWMGALALVVAGLTGLKYGRGKIVGPRSLTAPEHPEREMPDLWTHKDGSSS